MAGTKGYRSYHGRGSTGKTVLIVVLCVVLLAAVGFLIMQRYAVYSADGTIHFALPWREEKPSEPDAPAVPDASAPEGGMEVVIEQPVEAAPVELHARELDESVLRGSAEGVLASLPEEINAVAVRVKNVKGELLYDSKLTEAIDAGAVKGGSISRAAIGELTASEHYTIARVTATHDSIYSFAHMADAGILQLNHKGYIWYDPDSTFYLAPEKEAARAYLAAIARECAELGFDELLFDSFGYPPGGRLSNIDESARTVTKSEALTQFAAALRESVADFDVKLSVQLDAATVLAGENEKTGQSLALLAEQFDRVYVETTAEELPALAAAMATCPAELVPIMAEPRNGSYLLAA